jgi:two-component system, sensor histidine kinase PdtaS
MGRGDLTILEAARALRVRPWRGYAAAAAIYGLATVLAFVALPALREAAFICYLAALVLATLVGGGRAGLAVAIGGGLAIWFRLYPMASSEDAIALMLYVDATAIILYIVDALNRACAAMLGERDRATLLFSEGQHRIANTLMLIAGFLRRKRREAQGDPAIAARCLDEAVQRLEIFSTIHRQLSAPADISEALPALFRRLCDSLLEAAGADHVAITIEVEPVELAFEQVVILALLLTEIVINALKHAFGGQEGGHIVIRLAATEHTHIFEVRDNGRGLPSAPSGTSGQASGHRIMERLAAQLGGTLARSNDGGLRTTLTFPRQPGATRRTIAGAFAVS